MERRGEAARAASCFWVLDAVEIAVNECIRENILAEFLREHRAEAIAVSIFEYDAEKEMRLFRKAEREVGREEGREEGMYKERISAIQRMLKKNYTKEDILDIGYTEEEISEAKNQLMQLV